MAIQFEVHPSIGIARLGTSEQSFFGPAPGVSQPATRRDGTKKLLKQAARFRVFQCDRDAAGKLLSAPVAVTNGVRWTVEVANRKAAAVKLEQAGSRRNNATGNDATDRDLIIKPSAHSVDATTPDADFNDGKFRNVAVNLGHAKALPDGTLVFTGGTGISKSRTATGLTAGLQSFADNNDWFDDTCEGPVKAEVRLADGSVKQALAARVVVAPPDFAPEIEPWVTLWDIAYQAAIDRGFLHADAVPSYSRHILPFLRRAIDFVWVNTRSGAGHSGTARGNFATKFADLGNPATPQSVRRNILNRFRAPSETDASPNRKMPRVYSEEGYREEEFKVLALPPVFFHYFEQWVEGTFTADFGSNPFQGESEVDALDRMSLEACVGGGFFPGIEVPRFVLNKDNWIAPFRLDPAIPAGRVTEGLAVPWQADFSACQWEAPHKIAGRSDPNDPAGFAWWLSQRPDHVFRNAAAITAVPPQRSFWDRGTESAELLIDHYGDLGFILKQPSGVFIEVERELPEPLT